jgi:hypothetical protein
VLVIVVAWQYRNASYLAPLYPALAIASATAIPKRYGPLCAALAALLLCVKVALPHQPFGIPFSAESVNLSHAALDSYAALHRPHELIIIEPDDQFYSALLDLPRVRYVWLSPAEKHEPLPLDFEYLGITVSARKYLHLDEFRPIFTRRLREWGLHSSDPIATVILAETSQEVQALIDANPRADFYVAHEFRLSALD